MRRALAALALTLSLTAPAAAVTQGEMDRWVAGFRADALAQGIRADVFDAAFAGLTPDPKVVRLDRKQPEFVKPIWEYLKSAVSETRIANGRKKLAAHRDVLARIEQAYGVDAGVVLGIWGLESAYGAFYGDHDVIRALATLAVDGRREKFAREQIVAALRIIQQGDVGADGLKGSWAGAMGHVQFIPTSYHAYAVDFTGDGRRDLWSDDPSDALASAANYLARRGWRPGQPAFIPVRLPRGVDWAALDGSKRPASHWATIGVTRMDGSAVPDHGPAGVIIPAGARGPAFMTFHNFGVIKTYNNADSYAMGVAELGRRIGGGGPVALRWPEGDRPLNRAEKREMQTALTAMGFDTQGVDGKFGPDSRRALRRFQASRGMPADGYASEFTLDALRRAASGNEGVNAEQVRLIQLRLNERGYDVGAADGVAGPRTRAAILAFQRAAGQPASGQPSVALLQALALGD